MMGLYRWTASISNRAVLGIIFVAYLVLAAFLSSEAFLEILNTIHITIGLSVLVLYYPTVKDVLWRRKPMGAIHHLALGIVFTWWSAILYRMYGAAYRIFDLTWGHYSLLGFFSLLGIMGGVLHVTAPRKIVTVSLDKAAHRIILIAFIAGFTCALIINALKPHIEMWLLMRQ